MSATVEAGANAPPTLELGEEFLDLLADFAERLVEAEGILRLLVGSMPASTPRSFYAARN